MALFYCNCGDKFPNRKELAVHKGLLNIRWPRSDPSDEHWEVDRAGNKIAYIEPKEE